MAPLEIRHRSVRPISAKHAQASRFLQQSLRDYLVRGLLRPVACTTGGYGVFDDAALQRLCFVRAAFEAGIGLDALARLCRALDAADGAQAAAQLAVLRQLVERRRAALAHLDAQLASMPAERAHEEALP
ncbi:mercury resistance co-regulator MerD (plasmid) [Enterobacter hormaechei]|uniref:mercury resistance co-regulator MerD n=1 Tax=Enterobacter hormaechei TaxID=158836 RepID=UPI00403E75D5